MDFNINVDGMDPAVHLEQSTNTHHAGSYKLGAPEITCTSKRSVTLKWTAPQTPVTGYKIQYRRWNCTDQNWQTIQGRARTCTITGLQGSPEEYEFCVAAVRGGVTGPFSVPVPCNICRDIHSQRTETITLASRLDDLIAKGSQKKVQEFYKYVNSFLNEKGGTIVIHACNLNALEQFDQKVDKKLNELIPDGSLFQNKYERSYFDRNHLVYRIKPSDKNRPLSTLDFKTKVSSNKGNEPPSYTQMTFLIDSFCKNDESSDDSDSECEFVFKEGEEVFIRRETWDEPFQENLRTQAKLVPTSSMSDLVNYCWDKLKEYISSFTKIRQSCSIFFGVGEYKEIIPEWVVSEPDCVELTPLGKQDTWRIWETPQRTGGTQEQANQQLQVYFVSKAAKTKELQTGKFKTVAVTSSKQTHCSFKDAIERKANEELKWVGQEEPRQLLQFAFHPLKDAQHPDYCVLEITIGYYHGLCFYDKEGPELYRCEFQKTGTNGASLMRIKYEEWVKSYNGNAHASLTEQSYSAV
ncbi:hypothetical protein V1264_005998 [Littorina saxatilis]|uniref:Fibronectin type-III domain-containing protein n=2 Tax=Littorina saxatilis TaxID=31220 RepID=A0AAN9AW84_9CAEN